MTEGVGTLVGTGVAVGSGVAVGVGAAVGIGVDVGVGAAVGVVTEAVCVGASVAGAPVTAGESGVVTSSARMLTFRIMARRMIITAKDTIPIMFRFEFITPFLRIETPNKSAAFRGAAEIPAAAFP